jgi:hypothetical protein
VVEAMLEDALTAPYLCTDATGVLVLAKDRCKSGHFWVLVAPELHVLFRYSAHHDSEAVDDLLAGYKGYLVADAHSVYDHLYKSGDVVEVACWAHARRYWWKSMPSDPERANKALAIIGSLFHIERQIASSPRKKKREIRQAQSKPIVEAFFGIRSVLRVPPKFGDGAALAWPGPQVRRPRATWRKTLPARA